MSAITHFSRSYTECGADKKSSACDIVDSDTQNDFVHKSKHTEKPFNDCIFSCVFSICLLHVFGLDAFFFFHLVCWFTWVKECRRANKIYS